MKKNGLQFLCACICVFSIFSGLAVFPQKKALSAADGNAQPLPFLQSWTNTALIATDDNWDSVPGVIGYRGDGLTGATGADPQTILADGSATPVDVTANQTNPDTFVTGGVAEFEITNPAVALNGSGTADAPHIVVNLNTSGVTDIVFGYDLRDLDGSIDNAVQPIALQYRVGNTGNYTNIPSAFVADATTGPSQATLVTPVTASLPIAAENQPLVQVRIITANAVGNDEWVGIDNINVVGDGGGEVILSGIGSANPSTVNAGASTLLTVTVTPANTPPSTGITVNGNLATIGGSATQTFFDDATNGDVTAGDNIFSFAFAIGAEQPGGPRTLPTTIADAQARTASASISLTVRTPRSPDVHLTMGNPSGATVDVNQPFNYLMLKDQYVLSYHRDRGTANWVSWHLDPSWLGTAPRQDDFRADTTLPDGWYRVQDTDYSGSGFDRGHVTPSGDRTSTVEDNSATFLMTNMMPQAPDNNQGPWADLEEYGRTLVGQGNELYIISGGTGTGGVGSNGPAVTIANGNVTVPAYTWKVILVIANGSNDVERVNKSTRTIAVIMPNVQGIRLNDWRQYRTSVRDVEQLTGFDFFSNVSRMVQTIIERRVDNQ